MNFADSALLITGAGGQLGRAVVESLLARGATNIIAGSRTPDKLKDLGDRGVHLREIDFDRPETVGSALAGVDRLLLISTDSLEQRGKRLAQHRVALTAASEKGVSHVVYTSAPSPYPSKDSPVNDDHFWTEAAIFGSRFDWTILRNHLYSDLILMSVPHAIESGKLFGATLGAGRSYVTRADCARTAAAALLSCEGRSIYDVTGPNAVTQDQVAQILTELTGKAIAAVDVPPEALREGLSASGLPPFLVRALVDFDLSAAQGYHAIVTSVIERLTGKKPLSIQQFLTTQLEQQRSS